MQSPKSKQLTDKKDLYLTISAYGNLSLLELKSIMQSKIMEFKLIESNGTAVLLECDGETASRLITRCGGSFKIVKVCGSTVEDLLEHLVLPDKPKFNWTLSSYGVTSDVVDEARRSIQEFLKSKGVGKSRFIRPDFETRPKRDAGSGFGLVNELKLEDLQKRILAPTEKGDRGFDAVVVGNLGKKLLFGFTIHSSDIKGFENRDFLRAYQNPAMTIGPRLARVLVNLAMPKLTGSLLDPFCGLGTILQEAMILGYEVVGVDVSRSYVERTKTNLNWIRTHDKLATNERATVFKGDATILRKEHLPKIDGIATEPILLPKYEANPNANEATHSLRNAFKVYENSLKVFRQLLEQGSRVAIVAPAIIDSKGKEHAMNLSSALFDAGFLPYTGGIISLGNEVSFRVPSSRKRTIQRDVYVMSSN